MQLIGETIHHQQFGKGVVIACEHNIITIDFADGKRNFIYPDAFEDFLVPQDTGSQEQINDILVERKLQEKQQHIQNLEHQKKLAHLHAMKIPQIGQAVFDLDHQEGNNPLESGYCETGCYLSGYSKGMPRVPDRVMFNTMCILTRCPKGHPENERQILGLAMTLDSFQGSECQDGQIPLHPEFRLQLSKPAAIWPYLEKEPRKAWGHTTFKYIYNKIGEEILHDVMVQLSGTPEEQAVRKFYRYYCDCNRIMAR